MSKFNRNIKYKINELIVSKKDENGASLLVSLDDSDSFYKIDGIASEAWEALCLDCDPEKVIKKLTILYPDHNDQLILDLDVFFQKLVDLKVLIE